MVCETVDKQWWKSTISHMPQSQMEKALNLARKKGVATAWEAGVPGRAKVSAGYSKGMPFKKLVWGS
jgi:hypothetical protein